VLEPSPLLNTELPAWLLLHFQVDDRFGWTSPQVLEQPVRQRLAGKGPFRNVTPQRQTLLAGLAAHYPARDVLASVHQRNVQLTLEDTTLVPISKNADNNMATQAPNQAPARQQIDPQEPQQLAQQAANAEDYLSRKGQKSRVMNEGQGRSQKDDAQVVVLNTAGNGSQWFLPNPRRSVPGKEITVSLSPLTPEWLTAPGQADRLIVARLVRVGRREVCQGVLLDWPALRQVLTDEVKDLFPQGRIEPVHADVPPRPELAMTALPLQLEPGPPPALVEPADEPATEPPAAGWTPLRIGLTLAWVAAVIALLAVGLGGWSLLDLSERRIRFVSAVTHELRTPLTTLRLYLDMLAGGMVREERQRTEYLHTLNAETDRLNRLVANVLDFSRLENQRPRLVNIRTHVPELLEQLRATWEARCADAAKELVLENAAGPVELVTDVQLVQQILGNLIDNACKYSRGAADARLWLRCRQEGGRLVFEVEDRGPGVPLRERRSIFRPFRRGRGVEVTAGGVGLGLALAQRWAGFLGGRLSLQQRPHGAGACFRLELPG
jgi:signal transduction histidine kinase